MRHHTKDKGDLAVGQVIADLLGHGAKVCLPISEHLPFDLIAVSPSMKEVRRVQVKHVVMRDGCIRIPLRRTHSDRRGVHRKLVVLDELDAIAVFCPDVSEVYYVRRDEIPRGLQSTLTLRLIQSRNGQVKRVRSARDFAGTDRLFGPVA